jgi:hypothetical protein
MPNGGPRPDCVHCKNYRGRPISEEGDPYCDYHKINLAFPIYAFCSGYADSEPDGDSDWLDEEIGSRDQLRPDIMYVWIKIDINFVHMPLTSISEYNHWSREKYLSARHRLMDKHQNDQQDK